LRDFMRYIGTGGGIHLCGFRRETVLTPAQRSRTYFESGLYCAESVLQAIADECNLSSEYIPRIATGFCGGMALTGGGAAP